MLKDKEAAEIREELKNCRQPLFFYHDDPDGLTSFIMLYRHHGEGKGFVVKAHPNINRKFAGYVRSYGADKVFVLDIAMVEQEFIDEAGVPVVWIDHHMPVERENVKYFNPRISSGINMPTPALCYQVTRQDLWLAAVGCIGDWVIPPFIY